MRRTVQLDTAEDAKLRGRLGDSVKELNLSTVRNYETPTKYAAVTTVDSQVQEAETVCRIKEHEIVGNSGRMIAKGKHRCDSFS
jgi:hypothetical protein